MMAARKRATFGAICLLYFVISARHDVTAAVSDIRFETLEEQSPGYEIGDISAHWAAADVHADDLTYAINDAQTNSDVTELFTLQPISGVLTTAQRIDRDEMCKYSDSCVLTLQIDLISSTHFESISVSIDVIDINDNDPQFRSAIESIGIVEGPASANSLVPLPEANDIDSGQNSVQSYELQPLDGQFDIVTARNIDGTMEVQLQVLTELDREQQDSYTLYLVARDNGTPRRSSTMTLNVTVIDINDNVATFTRDSYTFNVAENVAVGEVVARVEARDEDAGDAGRIVYSFSPRSHDLYGDVFAINQNGEISLRAPLDYEMRRSYNLTVSASDSAPNARKSDALVIINVIDVNDFTPQISVTTLPNSAQAEVIEGAPVDTFIAHVSVIDRDSDVSGQVTCSLNNANFRLQNGDEPTQFKLLTASVFDRELIASDQVTITCRDRGSRPLTSHKTIDVSVLDVNDNNPRFEKTLYSAVLQENNALGVYVATVTATDRDYGVNGQITYSVDEPQYQQWFDVNRNGLITARRALDHEQQQRVTFHIRAQDGGNPARSAQATVQIDLLDVNDSPPVFTQQSFAFRLLENEPPAVVIGQLEASDADSAPYDVIRYEFKQESAELSTHFQLDRNTGVLTSRAPFDREAKAEYRFEVVAFNEDQPAQLKTSAVVTVTVDDVNDMTPQFVFPSSGNHSLRVARDLEAGEFVVQARAVDMDAGNNAWLRYSLTTGNEEGFFTIGENTGAISVARDLTEASQQSFNLTIVVRDHGNPVKVNEESLIVMATASRDQQSDDDKFPANMIILISLVSISGLLMIFLLVAILWLVYKSRYRKHKRKYDDHSATSGDDRLGPKVEIIDRLDTITSAGGDMNTSYRDSSMYDYQQQVREH